jgi:ketosteroid isomerase-like protein
MSHANVEIVRRMYEAHNRDGADAAEAYWAADIEMVDAPEFPDTSRQVGAIQVHKMLRGYMAAGWDGQFEVQEYLDVDPEVIVVWRMTARGPLGDFPGFGSVIFFHICLLEGGKLKRLRQFLSREQALEAVGLSE